jgi:hypothetical protein
MSKPADTTRSPRNQAAKARPYKHGAARGGRTTPEYRSWRAALDRCHNKNSPHYPRYSGRGIKVCPRWRKSFAAFLAGVGPKPSASHSLDRVNNEGGYEPGNCRWATREQQGRNKRTNRVLEYHGELATAVEWAERAGIPYKVFLVRLRHWSVARAIDTSETQNA